jgi:hypothetical protein
MTAAPMMPAVVPDVHTLLGRAACGTFETHTFDTNKQWLIRVKQWYDLCFDGPGAISEKHSETLRSLHTETVRWPSSLLAAANASRQASCIAVQILWFYF